MDKVLSRRVGVPNSQSIDTYVADGGYAGLRKVLDRGLGSREGHSRRSRRPTSAAAAAPASRPA